MEILHSALIVGICVFVLFQIIFLASSAGGRVDIGEENKRESVTTQIRNFEPEEYGHKQVEQRKLRKASMEQQQHRMQQQKPRSKERPPSAQFVVDAREKVRQNGFNDGSVVQHLTRQRQPAPGPVPRPAPVFVPHQRRFTQREQRRSVEPVAMSPDSWSNFGTTV